MIDNKMALVQDTIDELLFTTPLTGSQVLYSLPIQLSNYKSLTIISITDTDMALEIFFSNNGFEWDYSKNYLTYASVPISFNTNINSLWIKYKLTNQSTSSQTYLRLSTFGCSYEFNQSFDPNSKTSISELRSDAFGDNIVATQSMFPQTSFNASACEYVINKSVTSLGRFIKSPYDLRYEASSDSDIIMNNQSGILSLFVPTAVNNFGRILLGGISPYINGKAIQCRFTAIFKDATINVLSDSFREIGYGFPFSNGTSEIETGVVLFRGNGSDFGFGYYKDKTLISVSRSNFNIDKLDGSGIVEVINPERLNIYQLDIAYLGTGEISASVYSSKVGRFVKFHKFNLMNNTFSTHLNYGNGAFFMENTDLTGVRSTTFDAVGMGSFGVSVSIEKAIPSRTIVHTNSYLVSTTEETMFTIKNTSTFNYTLASTHFPTPCKLERISAGNEANTILTVYLYRDPVFSVEPSYTYISNSTMQISSTSGTFTSGTLVHVFSIPKNGAVNDKLKDVLINPYSRYVVRAKLGTGSSTNNTFSVLLDEYY